MFSCSLLLLSLLICTSSVQARKGRDGAGLSQEKTDVSNGLSLNDRVQQLLDLTQRRPVIKLTSRTFKELVRSQPKNYSVVVMFTALQNHRGCAICKQASDEFSLVANSYRYSQFYSSKMFFAMVDFDEGNEAFQSMNLNSAPAFIHFPPKVGLRCSHLSVYQLA